MQTKTSKISSASFIDFSWRKVSEKRKGGEGKKKRRGGGQGEGRGSYRQNIMATR